MNYLFRLATVNLFFVASIVVAGFYGKITPLFLNDSTHITYLISALIISNVIAAFVDVWLTRGSILTGPSAAMRWLQFNYTKLIYLGLLGTFFGFKEIITGFNSADDPATLIAMLKSGAMTLASCSIIGLVGYLWASVNLYLVGEE